MKDNIHALNDAVIVKIEKQNERTASGLYMTTTDDGDKVKKGTVVKISESSESQTLKDLRVGCTVWFNSYSTFTLKYEGEDYYVVDAKNLMMVEA